MKLRSIRLALAGLFILATSSIAGAQGANVGLCLAKPRHTKSANPQALRNAKPGKCWNLKSKDHQIVFVCESAAGCHYVLVKTPIAKQKSTK
jgi:hypothetical protein